MPKSARSAVKAALKAHKKFTVIVVATVTGGGSAAPQTVQISLKK